MNNTIVKHLNFGEDARDKIYAGIEKSRTKKNTFGAFCANKTILLKQHLLYCTECCLVYLKIAGVCGIVAVVATAAFCLFAGLHCAMQVNNKHIGLKYSKNVFLAFLSAVIAEIATLFAVAIAAPQFIKRQQFVSELGSCYYIEITLLLFNLLLCVLSYLSYTRARKTNFPRQREPYEITGEHYG